MASSNSNVGMKYRFLGDSGLLVSRFAVGSWSVFGGEDGVDRAYENLVYAFKEGVNFWDTAEGYNDGRAESVLGEVLQRGVDNKIWAREDIVISTKIYQGVKAGPNARDLSRKHIIEGTKASLKRLGVDSVDVLFCHHPSKYTPMEEIVRAMNFTIQQGWAYYWGTSEWTVTQILEACEIADKLGLIRPVVEQPQYNMFKRTKVEVHFQPLYAKYKTGLTTWSPLGFGLLTGKYGNGIPEGSRLSNDFFAALVGDFSMAVAVIEKLRPIAEELGCSLAQLALAWCAANEHVSTVLIGATSLAQLEENLKAFAFVEKITPDVKAKIDAIIPFRYEEPKPDRWFNMQDQYL